MIFLSTPKFSWLLILGLILFYIIFALLPNLRVLIVYSYYVRVGVAHSIIAVRELPPKEDISIFVSGEFLYGI